MATISSEPILSDAEKRRLARAGVQGTPFDPDQRIFGAYAAGAVFDFGDFSARDMADAIRRDGKVRSQYEVLTLPIRGAAWKIEDGDGDTGEADLVRGNLGERLGTIIDQATTAVAFRRAYWATSWRFEGTRLVYGDIELRPATSCEAGFDPDTGAAKGFRQRRAAVPGADQRTAAGETPGYVTIQAAQSFIYTHGAFASPITGSTDLDVALWCHQTKQKILFLWFQFLENQSLPKTFVYAEDTTAAAALAAEVAEMRASGVMGLPRPAEGGKAFDILESSGQGAAQFFQAAQYLDTMMVSATLAGFTELASSAAAGGGSYALSADQSDFFLASRQAVADEIAEQIRERLFGPLVRHNFGPSAVLPRLSIGPLSNRNTDRALTLLGSLAAAQSPIVPREFVDMLTQSTAKYLGLDPGKVDEAIEVEQKRRAAADEMKVAQQKQLLANPIAANAARTPGTPGAAPKSVKPGQPKPGAAPGTVTNLPARKAVALSRAVDVAEALVRRARGGEAPEAVLAEILTV